MSKAKSFLLPCVLFLGACTHVGPRPDLDLTKPLARIEARYTTERSHTKASGHASEHGQQADVTTSVWTFARSDNRVEITDPERHIGEAWLRDGSTHFYQKIFHADRKIVEYQQEDLSALNVPVNWTTNALMIDPRVLQQLQIGDAKQIDGHPALALSGQQGEVKYDVLWLTDLNIPYRLRKRDRFGDEETTTLAALMQAANETDSFEGDYEIIDYADLGDRERDPFIARIQQQLPGEHTHTH